MRPIKNDLMISRKKSEPPSKYKMLWIVETCLKSARCKARRKRRSKRIEHTMRAMQRLRNAAAGLFKQFRYNNRVLSNKTMCG